MLLMTALTYLSYLSMLQLFRCYAPVICNHPPTPSPYLRGWVVDSGANVRGSDLFSSLAVSGMCLASDLMQIYPMEFTITKSRAMTLSRSPQCRALSWAVMDEKLLSPRLPTGGGGSGYK